MYFGSYKYVGLAKKNNAKILQASTSEVYGDPKVHPQNENYNGNVNTIGHRSCYDEGKRCSETLFMEYKRDEWEEFLATPTQWDLDKYLDCLP